MATASLGLTRNFSAYTVPAAWILSVAPHIYAASLGKLDNKSPRTYTREVEADQSIDKATKGVIFRAESASQNNIENLGLFAAAVVIGNVARIDSWTLNVLSGGYLVSRVVYNALYIWGTTDARSYARSATYFAGIGMICTLFIKSGNVLGNHL